MTKTVEDVAYDLMELKGVFKSSFWWGSGVSISLLSFLGYTNFWTVPQEARQAAKNQVSDAVKLEIDMLVQQAISKQIQRAGDEQILRLTEASKSILSAAHGASGADQCVTLNGYALQMCWGEGQAKDTGHPWTRAFSFTFTSTFDAPPVIVPSVLTNSTGAAGVIYVFNPKTDGFEASINDSSLQNRSLDGSIRMSYIAIGKPKTK